MNENMDKVIEDIAYKDSKGTEENIRTELEQYGDVKKGVEFFNFNFTIKGKIAVKGYDMHEAKKEAIRDILNKIYDLRESEYVIVNEVEAI